MVANGLQQVHHMCLKLKHAFRSKQTRINLRDTPLLRSISSILLKERVLVSVMPGDYRSPFIDILSTSSGNSKDLMMTLNDVMTGEQKERVKVLQMTRQSLLDMHRLVGSDGSSKLVNNASSFSFEEHKEQLLRMFDGRQDLVQEVLQSPHLREVLPSVDSVPIPAANLNKPLNQISSTDLHSITWNRDRRLWLDLHYSSAGGDLLEPSISDMFLVSKGSRRLMMSFAQLQHLMKRGSARFIWADDPRSVVVLRNSRNGQVLSWSDLLSLSLADQVQDEDERVYEVLCVAK